MFDVFGRSWHLTKLSFQVIRQDKEMLVFPLLSGIFSLAYLLALLFPTVIADVVRDGADNVVFDVLDWIVLFVVYAGLAFIATFFNVCVVYTSKTRFEGGDATFVESVRFAASRLHHIVAWSLVSATVGIVLHSLDRAAERAGIVGRIVLGIVVALLGAAWSVLTLFVVPAMVYEDVGPIDALKRSAETLRATWGESLVRHYGLGFIQGVVTLAGVFPLAILLFYVSNQGGAVVVTVLVALIAYFLLVTLVFNVANSVFNTALYAYATSGETPGEFDDQLLHDAFYTRD